MKKIILLNLIFTIFSLSTANAQVGIGTDDPQLTLDVTGVPSSTDVPDGVRAPRLTLADLNAKTSYSSDQEGAIVYVTDVTGGSTVNATELVSGEGYYYFDGSLWQSMKSTAGSILFTASIGEGAGSQVNLTLNQDSFETIVLADVEQNLGGGNWDATQGTYEVPISGTYLIKSSVRLTDNSSSRNFFQCVDVTNADNPQGLWQSNSGMRWTMLYTRIAFFDQGDLLRLYIYSDGADADISDASLDIVLLSQN